MYNACCDLIHYDKLWQACMGKVLYPILGGEQSRQVMI